MYCVGKQKYR